MHVVIARLTIALDLLYDSTKDQTGLWSIISDLIEQLLAQYE